MILMYKRLKNDKIKSTFQKLPFMILKLGRLKSDKKVPSPKTKIYNFKV